jgi:hypothetical protein
LLAKLLAIQNRHHRNQQNNSGFTSICRRPLAAQST